MLTKDKILFVSATDAYLANTHTNYVRLHSDYYRASAAPLTLANAQTDCMADGGSIATFKTQEQFMVLKNANGKNSGPTDRHAKYVRVPTSTCQTLNLQFCSFSY